MTTGPNEEQNALILNTAAVNGAFEHPTPNAAWACAGSDPDLFFPQDANDLAEAIAVCHGCAVRNLCRSMGRARAESGVWGGVLLAEGMPQNAVKRRGRPPKAALA
jgi:hypothetical protein